MDSYYGNQYSYFDNSNAYGGGQSNPNTYGGGPGNPNAYGGGPSNPNTYGGGPSNPNTYGGGPSNPNAYGGSQSNPNVYGGQSNLYEGSQNSSNAYGGLSTSNTYRGGQSGSNAYRGGPTSSNTYAGSQDSSSRYGGQDNSNVYGGGQGNSNAYGGGQGNSNAYGGGQGSSNEYGGQDNSSAYRGGQGNPDAYGGNQDNSNDYGAGQNSSVVGQTTQPQGEQIYASRNENDSRKIFVGGLSWDVTSDELYEYFQQFGEVVDVNLKINPATNQSRGFGFVLFKEEAAVDRTVAHTEHILKGRTIDPKRAVAEGSQELNSKIFVGGIDPRMGKDEILETFTKFGPVKQIELPYDRVKNERRGFGFITFESEDIAELVCRNGKVSLGKRKVDVRRLNTKDNRPAPDAMGRPRGPALSAHVPPTAPPNRFPHQGRGQGRGAPVRGTFNRDGYVDPNVYQNNGMYRSGCSEEDDEFSSLQTAYHAIAAVASTMNMPIWGDCGGGYGGYDQPPFRGRGGYDRLKRGGPSGRGSMPGRGGGPARGGAPSRGGTGGQAGAGFHPYNR